MVFVNLRWPLTALWISSRGRFRLALLTGSNRSVVAAPCLDPFNLLVFRLPTKLHGISNNNMIHKSACALLLSCRRSKARLQNSFLVFFLAKNFAFQLWKDISLASMWLEAHAHYCAEHQGYFLNAAYS